MPRDRWACSGTAGLCAVPLVPSRAAPFALAHSRPPVDAEQVARAFFRLYCAGIAGEIQAVGRFLGLYSRRRGHRLIRTRQPRLPERSE